VLMKGSEEAVRTVAFNIGLIKLGDFRMRIGPGSAERHKINSLTRISTTLANHIIARSRYNFVTNTYALTFGGRVYDQSI
jgi:hypothetical protein